MTEPMKLYRNVTEAGLDDWRMLAQGIHARFMTGSFATGLSLVAAIGELAEAANHHPDLSVTWARVTVKLTTHSAGGITQKDLDLARRIEEVVLWRPAAEAEYPGGAARKFVRGETR